MWINLKQFFCPVINFWKGGNWELWKALSSLLNLSQRWSKYWPPNIWTLMKAKQLNIQILEGTLILNFWRHSKNRHSRIQFGLVFEWNLNTGPLFKWLVNCLDQYSRHGLDTEHSTIRHNLTIWILVFRSPMFDI